MKRAVKSGEIRKDLDPIDLLRALIGVSNVASSPIQLNAPTPPGWLPCMLSEAQETRSRST